MNHKVFLIINYAFLLIFLPALIFAEKVLPTNVTILEHKDFVGHNYYSVADVLINQPSLDLQKEGYRGTRAVAKIRGGSSSKHVVVLMDGTPLTHEFDSEVDLSQIPLNIVERIEITRGGSSARYGSDSIGGVINIRTTRPTQEGLVSRLETGVGRDGVKYSNGRFRGRSYWGDLTFTSGIQESGGFMFNEQHKTRNYFGNISRSFNGKGYWGIEYYFQESRVDLSNGTLVPFEDWNRRTERLSTTLNKFRDQESQHVRVLYSSPKISSGAFHVRYTQNLYKKKDFENKNSFAEEDQNNRSSIVDLRWENEGFEIGAEKRENRRTVAPFSTNKSHLNGIYLKNNWKWPSFLLSPSLRYSKHSNSGGFTSPRLLFIYDPFPSILFSGSATRSFRAPTFDELFIGNGSTPNSNLDFEKAWVYDLGIQLGRADYLQLKCTGFISRIDDLIQVDPVSSQFINRGLEKNKGLESEISIDMGNGTRFKHIKITGHWTNQQSQRDKEFGGGLSETALTPKNLGFVRLTNYIGPIMSLSNEIRYQSEQFELDGRAGLRIPSSTIWNIRYQLKILATDFYFEVENVDQRRYADTLANAQGTTVLAPQPERTYFAGFSMKFTN